MGRDAGASLVLMCRLSAALLVVNAEVRESEGEGKMEEVRGDVTLLTEEG